jgi:transcriptional regulator of acetoin/glycerol metabolism
VSDYRGVNWSYHEAKRALLDQFERKWLRTMAVHCDGDISEMARQGGIDRSSIHRLMRKHGFTREGMNKFVLGETNEPE